MRHSKTIIDENVLKKIYEDTEKQIALYEYNPTLLAPYYCNMEPMRFVRRIRLLDEYLKSGRYKVYYLAMDKVLIGYAVLAPGGRRLTYSSKQDIVCAPIFIDPQYRNKGYARLLKHLAFMYCTYPFEYNYGFIEKTNIASIKSVEKMGYEKVGELKVVGVTRKLVPVEDGAGTHVVYRIKKTEA